MTKKKKTTDTGKTVASVTTDLQNNSTPEDTIFQDKDKGRSFAFVVYPTDEWLKKNVPDCEYDGSSGYGTAPDDWREQLRLQGYSFAVSPLHDKDKNPDGSMKKPHWHIIVCWDNSTTYQNADKCINRIIKGPKPQMLRSVLGMYRYFQHLDNPEKHQYTEQPETFNDFEIPTTTKDVIDMKVQILEMCFKEGIMEYAALVRRCKRLGTQWLKCAMENTLMFSRWCTSFRSSPTALAIEVLKDPTASEDERKMALAIMENVNSPEAKRLKEAEEKEEAGETNESKN